MRLTLLFCDTRGLCRGLESDELPDQDESAVEPLARLLRDAGHQVTSLGVTFDSLEALPRAIEGCDAVFNLCDGSGVDGTVGPGAPALLQQLGVAFTGCSADPYLLLIDKARVREVLSRAGVRVPEGCVLASEENVDVEGWQWPVIVKPREGYGSLGVDHRSVVHDASMLPAAIRRARRAGDGDVLVERYLAGRELSVSLIGEPDRPVLLPAVEFKFGRAFAGRPAIRTLRSKHDPKSAEYRDISVGVAALEPALLAEVEAMARAAWLALDGDGYGRVDFRLDEEGRPYVIEVNANCSMEIGPEDCDCGTMVLASRLAGWDDARLLSTVLETGLARARRGASPVRSAMSGRWTPAAGHSLHALRPIAEGEVLEWLDAVPPAGRGARRPWRMGGAGVWMAPAPPLRWARAAPGPTADAHLEEKDGGLLLSASRPIARFEEIRVGGRRCRRGTTAHVRVEACS
ncbi:MAG TPA: ATP-grasp domain-containing protein [Myxococcales bacterium]